MITKNKFLGVLFIISFTICIYTFMSCSQKGKQQSPPVYDTLYTNIKELGTELRVIFAKGVSHNYPLMAIWIEDTLGNYIQTLYVAESIAKGVFKHGQTKKGKWLPGEIRRPAALPYWAHKRGIKEEDGLYIPAANNPLPDAITGETPLHNFILNTKLNEKKQEPFNLLFEINQTWDWNAYWTNNKYPDDEEYKTSCQPAVVYSTTINPTSNQEEYIMKPIGHSHYSGKDGNLYDDLTTLTTALTIAEQIKVIVIKK